MPSPQRVPSQPRPRRGHIIASRHGLSDSGSAASSGGAAIAARHSLHHCRGARHSPTVTAEAPVIASVVAKAPQLQAEPQSPPVIASMTSGTPVIASVAAEAPVIAPVAERAPQLQAGQQQPPGIASMTEAAAPISAAVECITRAAAAVRSGSPPRERLALLETFGGAPRRWSMTRAVKMLALQHGMPMRAYSLDSGFEPTEDVLNASLFADIWA